MYTARHTLSADLIADSILSFGIFTAFALDMIPSSLEFEIGSGPFSKIKMNHVDIGI